METSLLFNPTVWQMCRIFLHLMEKARNVTKLFPSITMEIVPELFPSKNRKKGESTGENIGEIRHYSMCVCDTGGGRQCRLVSGAAAIQLHLDFL